MPTGCHLIVNELLNADGVISTVSVPRCLVLATLSRNAGVMLSVESKSPP
jgi:hypothetical protein